MNILAVHIGGAHITIGVYDATSFVLIPGTYVRQAVNHRLHSSTILNVWKTIIHEVVSGHGVEITGCAICVPACFNACAIDESSREYFLYPNLQDLDIKNYFSTLLNLPETAIKIFSNSIASLKGEMIVTPSTDQKIIGLSIGTDFSAACLENGKITDLQWEYATFRNSNANEYLSTQWLLKEYYRRTNISVLNVEELIKFYRESDTVRKMLVEYKDNLKNFLSANIEADKVKKIIIDGDIVYAWPYISSFLNKNMFPVTIVKGQISKENKLLGAALLFDEDARHGLQYQETLFG